MEEGRKVVRRRRSKLWGQCHLVGVCVALGSLVFVIGEMHLDTVHLDTVYLNTIHLNTIHLDTVSLDTTYLDT